MFEVHINKFQQILCERYSYFRTQNAPHSLRTSPGVETGKHITKFKKKVELVFLI